MKAQREYPRLIITQKGTRWVEGGHPWIYEAEVVRVEGDIQNGCLADAVSEKGKYLGTGWVSLQSKIRLRLVSRNANDKFDTAFWKRRLQYAWNYRKTVMGEQDVSCCRVIFGEADGFPGLTVDKFSNYLVTQTLLNVTIAGNYLANGYWEIGFFFMEALIFLAEGILFAALLREHRRLRGFFTALLANAVSLACGWCLIANLPL